jgi:hypothetical protein
MPFFEIRKGFRSEVKLCSICLKLEFSHFR